MDYFFNQKKDHGYYDQPTHPTGQTMATAAMIAGILCVVTLWTLYLPIVIGGLGVIFAFLSLGFERKLSSNAKMGLIFSASGLAICVIILATSTFFLFNNPERFLEIGRQLDSMGPAAELGFSYEETVGQLINLFR
ncbi:MAG: hypothetical protein FWE14_10765 [Lachnospiraceae bacterium]|nr:hypothetical protein [Lachnospiraceae bacterium]